MAVIVDSTDKPILIPVFSDTHPNSTTGLCPPGGIRLDDGGWYRPSPSQLSIWDGYLHYWDRMKKLKQELDAICYVMFTGDGTDDNRHSKYQLVTVNEAVAVKVGVDICAPGLEIADEFFYCRGTEAHTHGSGALEEIIAGAIGATQTEEMRERGIFSRWFWELEDLHGHSGLFSHHPFSSSHVHWTKGGGPSRTAMAVEIEYGIIAQRQIPSFALFGHNHVFDHSGSRRCHTFFNMGWSIAGAFVHRIGRGWTFNELGGLYIIIHPSGEWEWDKISFRPRRPEPWKMNTSSTLQKKKQ